MNALTAIAPPACDGTGWQVHHGRRYVCRCLSCCPPDDEPTAWMDCDEGDDDLPEGYFPGDE